jgi:serine/threonine-protein kinase
VHLFEAGSYVVRAQHAGREIRYPIVIRRAELHRLHLDLGALDEVPQGMVLIPGGPFLVPFGPRNSRLVPAELPDFAIARYPVTIREYVRFLEAIEDPAEREMRTPRIPGEGAQLVRYERGEWHPAPGWVEGEGRKRVPPGRELDLPVCQIAWFDAVAYTQWLARTTGLPYRLPTSLEWDKAMRGADGRSYPMGPAIDPSFAKLRESRPEATQPEPIGAFPLDESPYGIRDLAGGIGDWTSTSPDSRPLPDLADEALPEAQARQAIWRGGAWSITSVDPTMRYVQKLSDRTGWMGFRVALSLERGRGSALETEPMKRRR